MDWIEILNKVGMPGAFIIALIYATSYMTQWHRGTQDKFLAALDAQRKENHSSLKEVVAEFKGMHGRLEEKIDELATEVRGHRGN